MQVKGPSHYDELTKRTGNELKNSKYAQHSQRINSVWVNSTESNVPTANQNELKTSPSPFHNLSLTYRQRSLIEWLTSFAYATRTVCEFKSITSCLCAFTNIYLLELDVIFVPSFEFGYLISPSMPKSKRAKICICIV